MQYSPKLKKAMEEIKVVLKKYDIGAMVVLHTPGHSEYLMNINPTYSCAFFEGDMLRVKAKKADYPTRDAWALKVKDTSNMLCLIGEVGAKISMSILKISARVDEIANSEHDDGSHTSHTQQNN